MKNFQYMLAPIEGFTEIAFRKLCYKYGAEITFTEMSRLESLARQNAATWSRINLKDELTPTIVQIIGSKEEKLKEFLKKFNPPKSFRGINLNLGCSSPQMVHIGQGCAMIKRITKTKKLIEAIKNQGYNASIKLRLGMNKIEKEKKVYLNLIKEVDADFFIVHARHGGETYNNPADHSVFPECIATGKKIIANGNIDDAEKVKQLKEMGVEGVMIGRAAIKNPAIFNELKGLPAPTLKQIAKEYGELAKQFGTPAKYQRNMINNLGKDIRVDLEQK